MNGTRSLHTLFNSSQERSDRSCTQAKLLGDQIGLDPIVSLLSIYIGWRVWRVWGMLLFPILFVTVAQLNEKGVIKLWKNV